MTGGCRFADRPPHIAVGRTYSNSIFLPIKVWCKSLIIIILIFITEISLNNEMAKKNKKIKHSPGYRRKKQKKTGAGTVSAQQDILRQALAHHQAGHLSRAKALYRQILATAPNHPDGLHYFGLLAHQEGNNEIAVELISKALALQPENAAAHVNLGNAFRSQGRLDEAVVSYRRSLSLRPDNADVHYNLGNTLKDQGRLDEAAVSYRRGLALQPDDAESYYNLGIVLQGLGRHDEAVASLHQALALQPDDAEAYFFLGIVLQAQGKKDESIANYRRALTLKPDFADAHYNLGGILQAQGRYDEAIASYRQVINLRPDSVEAHINLGNVLMNQGKQQEALASYNQALIMKPDFAEAHINVGNALMNQGRHDEAVASYRKALEQKADLLMAHSSLLLCLNYRSEISQTEIYQEAQLCGDGILAAHPTAVPAFTNSCGTDRRLRIGYVSPDFREHSVAFFIEPVIRAHNRDRVEVFCYANVMKPDQVSRRLQQEADHWLSLAGMEHEDVAARISQDRIDVLVDLAGHTRGNSLPVFARRPAPVQITWLGYPNTTGLRTINYRLTDAIADPAGEADRLYSEKLLRLKHGFLSYQPPPAAPEVGPSPCLERRYITFGSFNNLAKVTLPVIKAWAEILLAVPQSRLLMKARQLADAPTRERYIRMFARHGILPERLEMHPELAQQADHLALYGKVDIGLDPFPYNGTTTTCEALWMGVPVVTLLGTRHAGRVGASILHRLGLSAHVAPTVGKYIESACSLARDPQKLQEVRSTMRQRMQDSEVMDSKLFTAHLEDVFQQLWKEYCEGALPKL